MKAISIRQPWAELILQGRKIIELRTWRTNYRGRIAVHASQTVREEACRTYGLDPAKVVRGALIGTVELVDIVALDGATWEAQRDQHLSPPRVPGPDVRLAAGGPPAPAPADPHARPDEPVQRA